MDNKKEEGNLVSFRIFLERDGNIISEFKNLPLEYADKIFSEDESMLIKKIVKEGCLKLKNLHDLLDMEVQVI